MLCFVPVLHGCVWYVCCYVRKKALLQCLAITERRAMGLYEVPLSVSLLGFGIYYVSQLPCVRYYVFVKSSFKHTRVECESKRAMCLRCLIFNLSGPCELLFLLCFIASRT